MLHGHWPEQTTLTGVRPMPVRRPKVRDRGVAGRVGFGSSGTPPCFAHWPLAGHNTADDLPRGFERGLPEGGLGPGASEWALHEGLWNRERGGLVQS